MTTTIKKSNIWINTFINAIMTITIALILIFVPEEVYKTMVIVGGGILMTVGIIFVFIALRNEHNTFKTKLIVYIQALLNISIGIFLIVKPLIVLDFLKYFISIWLIIVGITQLFLAPRQQNFIKNTSPIILNSILSIGIGVAILFWPTFPLIIIGYFSIAIGVILLFYTIILFFHRNDIIEINVVEKNTTQNNENDLTSSIEEVKEEDTN